MTFPFHKIAGCGQPVSQILQNRTVGSNIHPNQQTDNKKKNPDRHFSEQFLLERTFHSVYSVVYLTVGPALNADEAHGHLICPRALDFHWSVTFLKRSSAQGRGCETFLCGESETLNKWSVCLTGE